MKCILCTKIDLRADIPMSLVGFGKCAVDEVKAHSVSFRFERQCDNYEQVVDGVKIKRTIWAESLNQKGKP